uniref:Uncharacterized protein K02A2.6-like n=1 Tax=Saccoglossus kowalevskii TaxID=10224 RepID=A0ABM0M8H7_SACKO|nr:PREDICTED: uncharacterized protein K02A2.6-like [Saccoglossus kowalevskii]
MYLADTLSRAYLTDQPPKNPQVEIESVNMVQSLPLSQPRCQDIKTHTESDQSLQLLKSMIQNGFPETKAEMPVALTTYFQVRHELSVQDSIIFRGERAIIPKSLRHDMLKRVHSSHLGTEGCLRRARECLYWPGMNAEIKDYIDKCDVCHTFGTRQQKETLITHEVPVRPWAKVGIDQFVFDGNDYLVTVDYFSNFWEVDYLPNTETKTIIRKLKAHFARHGIPDICISDNGPQEGSEEFEKFSKTWNFKHITSSPRYPQSNGKVENAVKSAKSIMRKSKLAGTDLYLGILDFRNTPTQGMTTSPAQRLMNRRTKTLLPITDKLLNPAINQRVSQEIKKNKDRQAYYYNKDAKDLPTLNQGDTVRMMPYNKSDKVWKKAQVDRQVNIRSFEVTTEEGRTYRRKCRHLRKTSETYHPNTSDVYSEISRPPQVRENQQKHAELPVNNDQSEIKTRSGRIVRKPAYLKTISKIKYTSFEIQ